MLNFLSRRGRKEIALSFICLFFLSGFASLRVQAMSFHFSPSTTTIADGRLFNSAASVPAISYSLISDEQRSGAELQTAGSISVPQFPSTTSTPRLRTKLPLSVDASRHGVRTKVSLNGPGPGQPEMASFKSVGADNMVSPFTGDFSYNIPLLDVGGYPVNLFYNGGITMDQEASWLGLGWNINPGTISRNMRGLPDDFDGTDIITKRQNMRPDRTWGVTAGPGLKTTGYPLIGLGVNISYGLSFNNRLGVAAEIGLHPSLMLSAQSGSKLTSGMSYGATIAAELKLNSRNGASITPSISLDLSKSQGKTGTTGSIGAGYTYSSRLGLSEMQLNASLTRSETSNKWGKDGEPGSKSGSLGTLNSSLSFCYPTISPSVQNRLTRRNYNLSFGAGMEFTGIYAHGKIGGYYSETFIAEKDQETFHRAFGSLHLSKANQSADALLDFNRLNESAYTPSGPAIAMPLYTYDIFNVSGEGTGGSFRAYRGDIGYMRDADVQTKESAASLGVDLGFGYAMHAGVDFSYAYSPTTVTAWKNNNAAAGVLSFMPNKGGYQGVYFKNPGEKTVPDQAFQEAVGGENLVRFSMANSLSGSPLLLNKLSKYDNGLNRIGETANLSVQNTLKSARDKRTQVVSFLSAEEAQRVGFDKDIFDYPVDNGKVIFGADCDKAGINVIKRSSPGNFRKPNHISEIDVLGSDGRKYVYGLPVYNKKQIDVSFAIDNGNNATGKSTYKPGEDGSANRLGRDWYMQQEETPAYANSFLLTALVSPNYVDVTENGLSADDMGDAVKFNYSKTDDKFKWRTPIGDKSAAYSEGLKTDDKDDKAHYIYGERENWYLYSIESKNMVARFYIVNNREDSRQVLDVNGVRDDSKGMWRLEKICLYSKGELNIAGNNTPKPIKTVQFYHSYKLCLGAESSKNGSGKLTLDSIRISYNGNNKKVKSRYVFYYPTSGPDANNPAFEFNGSDRWATYKNKSVNPNGLSNSDFPYTPQSKPVADKNAAAWTMNKILLPSGGEINIEYESDDYAYVQNRRAACMYNILGFGRNATPNLQDPGIRRLYNGNVDNNYIYIQLPQPLLAAAPDRKAELQAKYFSSEKQLAMRLSVVMPSGGNVPGLVGTETIPVYADIEEVGVVSATVVWVRVKTLSNDVSPMTQQVLQFLKQQLPGKAYPGYDMSENGTAKSIVLALAGTFASMGELIHGEEKTFRSKNKCREILVESSFARLDNPELKKLGGGQRVKKVTIQDNWDKMTNQHKAFYGQEYKYTTKALVNNVLTEISSGVASWEPAIGSDENPHKEIMRFLNHNKGGPYDFGAVDMPLGEALYPTPMVGYSRVEVLSVHRDTVKNLPTRQVTEFYTTKDFPFRSSCTPLSDPDANVKYAPSPIKQLLHLDMQKKVTQSQGFLVDMNDMNGKEKIQATYSANDALHPVSYTQNFYNIKKESDSTFSFNHTFQTVQSAEGYVGASVIGRDIELMADFRQHRSETITTNLSPNFDFFFLGIFPVPITTLFQPTIYEATTYRSASLLKIVNHYGMLDSVVSIDKGSMVSTKNMVYDAETGNPIVTRTNNEHNQPIYNFNYPAHWAYSGMGGAYKNIDASFGPITISHGIARDMSLEMKQLLESGDELYAIAENNFSVPPILPCDNNIGPDDWSTMMKSDANKIWAINTSKAGSITPQWIFMDKSGKSYNAKDVFVKIIRSGHRNMLDQSIGSITSLKNPIVNGKVTIDGNSKVIQTSSATFKDHWRVDNDFYVFDSSVTLTRWAPVKNIRAFVNKGYSYAKTRPRTTLPGPVSITHFPQLDFFAARQFENVIKNTSFNQKSWIGFDLSDPLLTGNVQILSAKLSLYAHANQLAPVNHRSQYNGFGGNLSTPGFWEHNNTWPHQSSGTHGNQFYLNRVIGQWPADQSPDWENHFNWYENANIDDEVGVFSTPTANYDFQWIPDAPTREIELTHLFRAMLRDKLDPAKNYAPGLKIRLQHYYNSNPELPADVCFYKDPKTVTGVYGGHSYLTEVKPHIDIKCFNCGDAYPLGYTPAPGEEVTKCREFTFQGSFCRSKFTQKKAINPYVEGILGNWRADSTYVYFGDRTEQSTVNSVDTRVGGTIANFQSFWILAPQYSSLPLTRNFTAGNQWVWNSTVTQFNRKGYEIETKDPLGRFNSGLYGYSQQLPTAVANNSRVREILFDGMEDYDYSVDQNCVACKPHRFFTYDKAISGHLDGTEHHTGKKSLKLSAGEDITISAPVTDTMTANAGYGIRIRIDSTYSQVGSIGLGLKAQYFGNPNFSGSPIYTVNNSNPNFTFGSTQSSGIPGLDQNSFSIRWTGKIKPAGSNSQTYKFKVTAFDNVRVIINGTTVVTTNFSILGNPSTTSGISYTMNGGQLYDIIIEYTKLASYPNQPIYTAGNTVEWTTSVNSTPLQGLSTIPLGLLYSPANVYSTVTDYCKKLDSVNILGNGLTDTFSLLQSKRMLVSAWVKRGNDDCKCVTYPDNYITVTSHPGSASVTFTPQGSIIEGWQRYEGVFDVGINATSIKFKLHNTGTIKPIYFDDIRIQPFNANMKTFVYDPFSLRLSAELDENNYATLYEYDDDGTLTRVKKETREGIKTITETRSALQQSIAP